VTFLIDFFAPASISRYATSADWLTSSALNSSGSSSWRTPLYSVYNLQMFTSWHAHQLPTTFERSIGCDPSKVYSNDIFSLHLAGASTRGSCPRRLPCPCCIVPLPAPRALSKQKGMKVSVVVDTRNPAKLAYSLWTFFPLGNVIRVVFVCIDTTDPPNWEWMLCDIQELPISGVVARPVRTGTFSSWGAQVR